jgi:cytochrome c-type biogenesis protein CcmH/NrfG
MIAAILFVGLAAIIALAIAALISARRWQAQQAPPDAPLDMARRAQRQARPTGMTVVIKRIEERGKR